MKLLWLTIGLGGLGVGCAQASPENGITFSPCERLVVVVDGTASPAQQAAVGQAIALWNGIGVGNLTLTDSPGATTIPLSFKTALYAFHGVYEPEIGDVLINQALTDPHQIAVVAAHELGHAMGLVHVPTSTRTSVMNPDNLQASPTLADLETVSSQWQHCPLLPPPVDGGSS